MGKIFYIMGKSASGKDKIYSRLAGNKELDLKKARIYEQLMGELEPKGIRIVNFNKLSDEEGKLLKLTLIQRLHHICQRTSSASSSHFHF